jgi:hypothetical protein
MLPLLLLLLLQELIRRQKEIQEARKAMDVDAEVQQ